MTTLADMTPQERLDSIGMWADVDTERYPAVIVRTYAADDVDYAQMLCPELNDYYTSSLATITPRDDLPRAWQADGTPVEMDVETSIVCDHPRGGMIGSYESPEYVNHQPGTTMRRFVGEWQEE